MKIGVLLVALWCVAYGQNNDHLSGLKRRKRDAVGALDIVTNNAQSIHAEVKPENGEVTEKPCSKSHRISVPSQIEPGVVFQLSGISKPQDVDGLNDMMVKFYPRPTAYIHDHNLAKSYVTPPRAAVYETKSLRKSLPLNSRLDLIRGISRIVTLSVLAISAVFEFYPIVKRTYDTIMGILYY